MWIAEILWRRQLCSLPRVQGQGWFGRAMTDVSVNRISTGGTYTAVAYFSKPSESRDHM